VRIPKEFFLRKKKICREKRRRWIQKEKPFLTRSKNKIKIVQDGEKSGVTKTTTKSKCIKRVPCRAAAGIIANEAMAITVFTRKRVEGDHSRLRGSHKRKRVRKGFFY